MYVAHPFLRQPADDAKLWRYVTPTVFLAMLLRRSLHFAPLDSFEDPFEGVPPRAVLDAARARHQPTAEDAPPVLARWREMIERCRATVCASCWHLGDEESEAMWKLYGRYEDGLATVSTLASIRNALRDHEVTGGLVDYSGRDIEPGTREQDLLRWATTKRPSYRHENEFRLLAQRRPGERVGDVSLPVDPEALVEEVVLSPRMEP
jgi:hypothetical protein